MENIRPDFDDIVILLNLEIFHTIFAKFKSVASSIVTNNPGTSLND